MNLTRSMLVALRGRFDRDESDTSIDSEFLKMTPEQIVRECVGWHLGDPGWTDRIAGWMVAAGAKPEDF